MFQRLSRTSVEKSDTRNSNFRFYVDGMQKAAVRIGMKDMADGQLKLKSMMSMFGATTPMDADGVVKDIWEHHVEVYLR